MGLMLLQKSELSHDLYKGVQRVLAESEQSACGVILAACPFKDDEFNRLVTRFQDEEGETGALFLYEPQDGVLAVICGGKPLSGTHWLALKLKLLMQGEFGIEAGMLVTSFPECGNCGLPELEGMVQKLAGESARDSKIHLYSVKEDGERNPTVVIIDDDREVADFLNNRLRMKGYDVHQAYDGLQGIRLCEKFSPDVVITELTLPVYDGYQVIRNIQQNDALDSKIVVLSERRMEKDVSACFEMGVADYVKKPYSPVELEARLRRLLS